MANSRYLYKDNTKTDSNGKKVYKSILYPKIDVSDDDIYIISNNTDRLDLLSFQYYGDVTKWWIIAKANSISGTFNVPPGMQLRIPINIDKIIKDLQKLNE